MAEKLSLRTDANGNIYVYVEDTAGASLAFGADSANSVVALNTSPTANVQPDESTANMTIDPSANGDVLFRPHGTGKTEFNTGNVQITEKSLYLPHTSNDGADGCIFTNDTFLGYQRTISFPDDWNIYIGKGVGGVGTYPNVVGVGYNVIIGSEGSFNIVANPSLHNIGIGQGTFQDFTGGSLNIAIGRLTLSSIVSGANNIAIGSSAGSALSGSNSNNVCIANEGVSGDSGVIRIGTNAIQNTAFVQGIHGVTPAGVSQQLMIIDSVGQIGSTSGGSFGINTIHTESGDAVPAAGAVTITGGNNIGTSGAGSTVTVTVDNIVGQTNGGASIVPFVATATGNISETPGGAATMNSGTQSLSISSDASATTVNVATGAAVKTLTLGSTNSTSASTLQSGSGALNVTSTNGSLTINSGTGALSVSSDASATTVNLATGGAAKTVTLGSTNTTSALTLNSGSGGIKAVGVASVSVSNKNYVTIDTSTGALGSESVPTPTAMVLLQTATASTSANLVLSTGISSTYVAYFVSCNNLVYDSGANPTLRVEYSNDGGSSWIATNYNAAYLSNTWNSATIANTNSSTICPLAASASGAGNQISGYLWFQGLAGSGKTFHEGRFFAQNVHYQPYGWNSANNTINALRFSYSAGNITSGTISLYGLTH